MKNKQNTTAVVQNKKFLIEVTSGKRKYLAEYFRLTVTGPDLAGKSSAAKHVDNLS
ncbi:MAG: hypothetical protein KKD01_05610 [Proteobacteria bacterium]|nr:hypothetical protein [Pseudomonadota bacterium]MBU1231380.1 hypothetical protein [Pseudomonadota bacterium]MBU1418603.1 hypothetical protein [Pseudomonadota bacterium]MBU1454187.1 hypothetical protein [Pseudomonadota bacterium]